MEKERKLSGVGALERLMAEFKAKKPYDSKTGTLWKGALDPAAKGFSGLDIIGENEKVTQRQMVTRKVKKKKEYPMGHFEKGKWIEGRCWACGDKVIGTETDHMGYQQAFEVYLFKGHHYCEPCFRLEILLVDRSARRKIYGWKEGGREREVRGIVEGKEAGESDPKTHGVDGVQGTPGGNDGPAKRKGGLGLAIKRLVGGDRPRGS